MLNTKNKYRNIFLSSILGVVFLVACGNASETLTTEVSSERETKMPATQTPTTEIEVEMATETPEAGDACLNCHAEKQRLIDTAKPEEEAVEESSGAG